MTLRFKYYLYLLTFCLVSGISVQAQFSEEDLEKQANDLFESGKYAEAMPLYSQLLSLNPTKPQYNYKYGATALYGDADKKEEAVKFLKFATKKGGVDDKAFYFLGRAYHLNYQFADAVRAYETYRERASNKDIEDLELDRHLESARSGLNLLSKIKDVKVLDKKLTAYESFFRVYDLGEIGGKILVTPDELLSSLDKKNNHKSLIHFRGTGTTVYFSSYGKDGKTGLDIYKAQVLPGGTFSDPVKLGGFVNTDFDEDYPFMHPDGKTFYFSSTGHSSMGGFDIFKCFYDPGMDVFSQPENLDFAINTPDDELFYIADTAKKMANFASARSSKQGELHVYKVLVQSNPIELTLVKGSFINRINSSQKLAKIAVIDAATNEKVSEQYTDPNNGDYVVSVPKNGKYKFVVEVQNSDKVHAGMVDIPRSAGVKAYLQEMELVLSAGVEKLLINNRFDETYDGDVLALAKDLLRKQAELDVNFDPEQEPIPEPQPEAEEDFALVYKKAGFPAGMSNEKVLETALARKSEFQNTIQNNLAIKARVIEKYIEKTTAANLKLTEAEDLLEQANKSDGDEKAEMMFSAAILKMEAGEILKEARSAEELAAKIDANNRELGQSLTLVSNHADSLKDALDSENYEAAIALMSKESRAQKGELDEFKINEVEESLLQSSLDAKERSANLMKRSAELREEADELNAKLITRKRQLEKAKGKDAKELEVEVNTLENQLIDLEETIKSSFERANKSQEIAASEELQYTFFSNFNETNQTLSPEAEKSLLDTEIGGSDLNAYSDRLLNLSIDRSLVSEYAKQNPGAFSDYDPNLKRMVASAYLDDESESAPENEDFIAENLANDSNDLVDSQTNSENSGADQNPAIQKENIQDSDPEQNEIEKTTDSDILQENSTEDLLVRDDTKSNDPAEQLDAKPDSNKENIKLDKSLNLSAEKRIEAEQIKVKAAQDWLLVIDASIADLEQGVGGEDGEDVQAQLDEYRELKQQKLSEIAKSEQLIAGLSADVEEIDGYAQAAKNAESDLEQLSSGQVASLESKIDIASSDIEFVRDISKVDPDYIPEITSAELSGLSAPEIASQRIEINKTFLVSLDKLIRSEGLTDLSDERLRELRNIKLLEIQQDEQVAIGAQEYVARTEEAREYQELISETTQSTETDIPDLSALSPEMQEDLKSDFNRTMVMASYEPKLASISNSKTDSSAVSERLELNKSYLQSLQNEINFYSQTIELQGENAPVELKDRYNELLADRSRVADEIQEDQNILAELTTLESKKILAQTESEKDETDPELPSATTLSEQFDESYQSQLEDIKNRELTEAEELKALAGIRFQQAERADSLVAVYINELDNSESPEVKDEIQQLIQNLDAIAADKRQEADRLMYESDILASSATDDSIPEEEITAEDDLPESREPKLGSDIDFGDLTYKSLNANIAYSKLQNKVDSVNAKKLEIESLVLDYNSATDQAEKRSLLDEIDRKELQLKTMETSLIRDVSQSNAAEIAYYQKANDQMLKSIESEYSNKADLAEYSERASEISEMLSKNESERSKNNKSESDYLADELALISSLSDLNADMENFIASQDQTEDGLALNTIDGSESPYELLMRNPKNHTPEEGKKYLAPIHRQVESGLTEERRSEIVSAVPILQTGTDFANNREEGIRKEILSHTTSVDERGYELLKADPDKLEYVLAAVTADSLKTLENENAVLAKARSQSANEKYMESARLRNMVVHQNSESEKELVRKRAEKLETEAKMDIEVASIAAKRAEELRLQRIAREEQLAATAKDLSNSDLNELNALLRKETYTIIPSVDLGSEEVASVEPEESTNNKATPETSSSADSKSAYSKDEMDIFNNVGNWLDVVEIIGEKDDFSDVEESLFVESEKSAYSEENPIPIDPVMPDGLIFQVQVGAFRNPIPQDLYKEFAPVMGQRLSNGITRYRAGLFRIYKEARDTRDQIREKGYSDAFVVVYVDGERLTGAQARQILAQAKEMANEEIAGNSGVDQPQVEETAEITEPAEIQEPEMTPVPDYYNDPEAAEATQVEITQGLFYTVQVGVYSKPVKLDKLFNLTELNSELTNSGYIRYTSGRYVDVEAAQIRRNMVVQKGVTDAFITAYYNGKRISLGEARNILEEQGKSVLFNEEATKRTDPQASDDLVEYIVIMGMNQSDIPEELANSFIQNEDWNIQKTTGPGGQEMYISPKFTSLSEAREFLKLAKESGVESAIMGKMVNGSITDVDIEN